MIMLITTFMIRNFEGHMGRRFTDLESAIYEENEYRNLLVELFEQDGWRVKHEVSPSERGGV